MEVLGYDAYPDTAFNPSPRFRFATLDEVLSSSDAVSLHCPHASGEPPLIDRAAMARMRKGAYLVNTARGGLVDDAAVLEGLEQGRIAGYAVDAYDREPPEPQPAACPMRRSSRRRTSGHSRRRASPAPHAWRWRTCCPAWVRQGKSDTACAGINFFFTERDDMLKGYCGRVLRVDLGRRAVSTEPLKEELIKMLLGGRGIAAKYYWDEIPAGVDELGEKNKIFFFTGPLTGTPLVSTTKFQLATKSPETRMYLCSNCGGDFGPQLKQAGFDGLIIEGRASDWTYLTIRDGKVEFGDASPWKGLPSTRTLELLREAFGETKCGAMSIGPAGENLVRLSYINVDNRAFGRGGPARSWARRSSRESR